MTEPRIFGLDDHPDLAALFDFWNERRTGEGIPSWSAFDPVDMRRWLGRLNLVAVEPREDGTRDFVYRVFATEIAEMIGREMTGRPVGDDEVGVREALISDYATVADRAVPLLRSHDSSVRSRVLRHVRLMLPLTDTLGSGGVTRVLVGVHPLWQRRYSPLVSAMPPAIDPDVMFGARRLREAS